MTSGDSNFNYFTENQLTTFKLCPPTSLYFCSPTNSVTLLHRRRGAFGRPWAQKSVHMSLRQLKIDMHYALLDNILTVFKSESTGDSAQRHYDVFIEDISMRCTFRFMLSLLPPAPPWLIQKNSSNLCKSHDPPNLVEVGWAMGTCPPVAMPVVHIVPVDILWC